MFSLQMTFLVSEKAIFFTPQYLRSCGCIGFNSLPWPISTCCLGLRRVLTPSLSFLTSLIYFILGTGCFPSLILAFLAIIIFSYMKKTAFVYVQTGSMGSWLFWGSYSSTTLLISVSFYFLDFLSWVLKLRHFFKSLLYTNSSFIPYSLSNSSPFL